MANVFVSRIAGILRNVVIAASDIAPALQSPPPIGGITPNTGQFTTLGTTGSTVNFGGPAPVQGGFYYQQNGQASFFGIYDSNNQLYYGFQNTLAAQISGVVAMGGWYKGLGILANTGVGGTNPIFGINTNNQVNGANGVGGNMFGVLSNGTVTTYYSTLDDGTGNATFKGAVNFANGATYKVDASGNAVFLSLNSTPIGATTPSTGNFTAVITTGAATIGTVLTTGGLIVSVATKTAAYTLATTDFVVECDATSAAFTVTLPASPKKGQMYDIVKIDSSANAVTINGNGKLINGASTVSLASQYAVYRLVYNGSSWRVL